MADQPSDAIVFFGATGDLAYKQIFPALLGLVRDEGLNVPIIGVAKAGWNLDQLKARAADSLQHHGGGGSKGAAAADGPAALCRWRLQRCRHIHRAAQAARRSEAAAALSRRAAQPVRDGGASASQLRLRRQCASGDREAVRPQPRYRARVEPTVGELVPGGEHLPDRPLPRQGAGPEHRLYALRQLDVRAAVEPRPRQQHPDHHGGEISACRIAAASTTKPARSATWCRTTCCRCWRS